MITWKFSIDPIILRNSDDTLWYPDGSFPFPFTGFNFCKIKKAKIGWWSFPYERFFTCDSKEFNIISKTQAIKISKNS